MTGVVLCGGQSLRMGADKGLLVAGGNVWANVMRQIFAKVSMPVVLSINAKQKTDYLRHFSADDLLTDNPDLNVQGPLLGLLSAHLKYPDQDLMILACDMINMNVVALAKLQREYQVIKPAAIAFRADHVEPACAIYSAAGLKQILHMVIQNQLPKNSLTHVLQTLGAVYISIPDEWKSYFRNLNSAADLI